MGIFETIMGIATLAETKGTRDEIAAHQAAIDRIEKGMSTKEDITSVLGCLASLKRDTSYLHTEVMFAGAGVPVSFDQAGLMRRYDPKMLQNGTPQMPAGNSGAPTSMYPQTPIVPTMTPYGMQQLVQQTPVQAQIPSGNPVASRTTASPSENKNMMVQSIVCGDDIRYFAQQPQSELTLIVGQMTSLLESISDLKRSTDSRVERLQNQGWFKRMWNTITGKNKATKEEIRRNQDKIVGYISESVAQLYKMNLIELQVMQSIGNRINQVYAQLTEVYNEQLQMRAQITEIQEIQQQTIRSLGEIANTLDEKIESIDNFHLLITEIQQKKYKNSNQLYGLCCVLAQLDRRTTEDKRKLNILKEALIKSGMISQKPVSLRDLLMEIIYLSDDKVGTAYLALCNYSNSFPANIFIEMIESFHFLTKIEKLSKRKKTLIQSIIDKYNLESSTKILYLDIFEIFLENSFVSSQAICMCEAEKDATTLTELGFMYYYGKDVERDYSKAFECYYKAAEQGDTEAQYQIASMYNAGEGIEQDRFKALEWYYKAAEQGSVKAQRFLGMMYFHGTSNVEHDYSKAFEWYCKAAEQGDKFAQEQIRFMYYNNLGVPKDKGI